MKSAILAILAFFVTAISYSQTDSASYIQVLAGTNYKKWYPEKQDYLGNKKKPCKGKILIIYAANQQLVEESCDKKQSLIFFWKLYRDAKFRWRFSYGGNDYAITFLNDNTPQRIILTKRNYLSKRSWTYIHLKD
jgi:hypothetical protein